MKIGWEFYKKIINKEHSMIKNKYTKYTPWYSPPGLKHGMQDLERLGLVSQKNVRVNFSNGMQKIMRVFDAIYVDCWSMMVDMRNVLE